MPFHREPPESFELLANVNVNPPTPGNASMREADFGSRTKTKTKNSPFSGRNDVTPVSTPRSFLGRVTSRSVGRLSAVDSDKSHPNPSDGSTLPLNASELDWSM